MKKLIYIAIALCAISCKKFLDTKPTSFTTPVNFYSTADELQTALNGVYDVMGRNWNGFNGIYQNPLSFTFVSATDESCLRNTGSPQPARYVYDAGTVDVYQLWQALYKGIAHANLLLENIDKPQMDSAARNAIRGQALFLRGYYHFLLVQSYGDVPLVLKPTASINNTSIPRTPAKDVYAQVIKDMTDAETLLQNQTITKLGYGGKVTKTAVQGILARVFLNMAGYPLNDATRYHDAVKWAAKVINSGEHALATDYKQIFLNLTQDKYDVKESIFEVEFFGNSTAGVFETGNTLGNLNGIMSADANKGNSAGWIYISGKLYNAYAPWDSVRKNWNCANYNWGSGGTAVYTAVTNPWLMNPGKFRREYEVVLPRDKNTTPINFPILRYSDVLLMYAEAANKVGGPDVVPAADGGTLTAYEALNQIRRRAFKAAVATPNVICDLAGGLDQQQFQDSLRIERMRELCFEGQRKFDLIRWGNFYNDMRDFVTYATANGGNIAGTLVVQGNPSQFQNLGPRNVLLPIPTQEITVNPLLSQNPGW